MVKEIIAYVLGGLIGGILIERFLKVSQGVTTGMTSARGLFKRNKPAPAKK